MTQNTNLNVSPYFDDFSESNNYNKVLFKPGFPVQSRELTTLQSILQNQIERFGQYFFKEGSMVIPGGNFLDTSYFAVRIDPQFLNIPVREYTQYLVDNGIEIEGETTGVTANVVNRLTDIESVDGYDTLYIKYKKSGTDGVTREFADGENLITRSDIEYSNTRITAGSLFARTIASESTKTGSSASVSEGIFFIRGFFVKVPSSTIVLDQYSNRPSYRVGLSVTEEIVSASSINRDLYDNAKGFSNESAPGADRFRLSVTLTKKALTDADDLSFVELMRVEDGRREEFVDRTEFATFKDELARRTYEESGDYYIKPFKVELRETLNDRIGNRGLYFSNQVTKNGNTPSDDIYTVQISPGKAYVRGHEVETKGTVSIDAVKPRTVRSKENASLPIKIGNIAKVENVYGSPTIGFENYVINLKDQRLGLGRTETGATIGHARVFDYNENSPVGAATARYDTRLYDVETFTNVTVGTALTAAESAYVKGVYSGSSGFLVSAASNATILSLSGVRGEFQLNEPLEINGNSVGRNITAVRKFDFSDVKSLHRTVGVSTFAGDVVLSRPKQAFTERSNFRINHSTKKVTSTSVADFRSLVKVGDIVRYPKQAGTVPTFNRVTAVAAGELSIDAIPSVTGICDGTLSETVVTNDFDVITGALQQSDKPGYRIPLPNRYISSINLLDSTYIVRKQISKNITSAVEFTFNISDLGDNDLKFEPYTSSTYTLTWEEGQIEVLQDAQVTLNNDLTTVTFRGLSRTGNGTLTFTAKRTKLLSKTKSIKRCEEVIINRSKLSGAGIGATTFNNGLNGPNQNGGADFPYGTRVEDQEICLNFPEIYRVLGVFQSSGVGEATLPSFTSSSQSSVFTNNVVVGEQIIGASSGSVARVVEVTNSSKVEFVYENEKAFEIDESFTMMTSGIVGTIGSIVIGDPNIGDSYTLDKGHREDHVDFGRIIRKDGIQEPTRQLKIILDRYETNESVGTVESVNSYNGLNYTKEILNVIDMSANDFIDIRPRVSPYSTSSTKSPFDFDSRSFVASSSETIVSNKTVVLDYSYYLGRTDRLYLLRDGTFELIKGVPSENPKAPVKNDEAMEVGILYMDPYIFDAKENSRLKLTPHKRYTMKDIGVLESRIKNLEEYTTLSLLETDTKNLQIKDSNTGLDKFKSGFFVDNFKGHLNHNLRGDSFFDIDRTKRECRPRSTERNVSLGFETVTTIADPVNADYAWAEDFEDSNITRSGPGLTLNYEEVEYIDQPLATRTENLNPFHITLFTGVVTLTPESDFWVEENVLDVSNSTEIDSAFQAIADLLGVDDRENGGMASSIWNTSDISWNGQELISEETVRDEVIRQENNTWLASGGGRRPWWTTTTTTRSTDVLQTFETTGLETITGLELTSTDQLTSLGNTVVSTETIFTVRSRNIELNATNLKPNTRYYVFMENVDMNAYAVPKRLPITMTTGSFVSGEIIESVDFFSGVARSLPSADSARIIARVAQADHKIGPFNAPTQTYGDLSSTYSNTSSVLNIDTADLALLTRPDRLGWVRPGQVLASRSGQCVVNNIELMTDDTGTLIFSLHIPDPTNRSNPRFSTGSNNITITTSPTNASILDPGESKVNVTYQSSGIRQNLEEQILSIRQPQVQEQIILEDQPVSQITESLEENIIVQDTNTAVSGWFDPLAQSFFVNTEQGSDGVFITSGDVYFRSKDPDIPVTVQIRTMRDGSPTNTVVPFGETQLQPDEVLLSQDGSVATRFTFSTPVYLQSGTEYALVLISPTSKYLTYITRMGEVDLLLNSVYNRQPYLGSLFKSQNNTTWDASQLEDLKFKLFKAKFPVNTPSTVIFYNNELPMGKIRKSDPLTVYSKRQTISIAATTSEFAQGTTMIQGSSSRSGNVFSSGGPVDMVNATTSLTLTGAGIGIPEGTFTGIGFTTLSGNGSGLEVTLNTTVATGVGTITVTNGGSGYQVGDLLLSNKIGDSGSGARVTVGIVTMTNKITLDDVTESFVVGTALTHTDGGGTDADITAPTAVDSDIVRDGFTFKVDHRNHGMHAGGNVVKIENVIGDVLPTSLTSKVDDDSTTIDVVDGTNFASFEGVAVSGIHTGYVKIDKEIISYNSINGNEITIAAREIDDSLKSDHGEGSIVNKYEFNGVSLLKINKEHTLDNRDKTFNSYLVKINNESKAFNTTIQGGGAQVNASQNIPFEYVRPDLNAITPSGTSINARVKTTSGTSISGSEISFQDKGYENIAINKLNNFDDPRIVASKTNEFNILGNQKSFALELTLQTRNENVSPIIDLESANIIVMSNLVNDEVSDYETDSRARLTGLDPNAGIYETQRINLEFASNSLYVQFDGHREAEADFHVFYKLFNSGSSDGDQVYIPFNGNGSPDKVINPNDGYNKFSDYKFTADNVPQFNSFMIKVVMTSTNQAKAPRFKNFRAIALRSFEDE